MEPEIKELQREVDKTHELLLEHQKLVSERFKTLNQRITDIIKRITPWAN